MLLKTEVESLVKRQKGGYWYLASPYTKYAAGIEQAYKDICRAAASLIVAGVNVYCPIAHTHPISVEGGLDPLDHTLWLAVDAPLMESACGLLIVEMPGWKESYGVQHEIAKFEMMEKPITSIAWPVEIEQ